MRGISPAETLLSIVAAVYRTLDGFDRSSWIISCGCALVAASAALTVSAAPVLLTVSSAWLIVFSGGVTAMRCASAMPSPPLAPVTRTVPLGAAIKGNLR